MANFRLTKETKETKETKSVFEFPILFFARRLCYYHYQGPFGKPKLNDKCDAMAKFRLQDSTGLVEIIGIASGCAILVIAGGMYALRRVDRRSHNQTVFDTWA